MVRIVLLVGAFLALVGAGVSSPTATSAPSADADVVDLGALGGQESFATAINDRGWVVGSAETAAGTRHAFLWRDGVIRDLGTLPGRANSSASGINRRGDVAGSSDLRATVWFDGGQPVDLDALGFAIGFATDINDARQVVGLAGNTSPHGFIWENGAALDLGTLAGDATRPASINRRGEVVGDSMAFVSNAFFQMHPFLWQNGTLTDLGIPSAAENAAASDINDKGWIVGSTFGNVPSHPLLYRDGTMTDLGFAGSAAAVNNHGQIVGSRCLDAPLCTLNRAVLYEDGVVVDLNTLLPPESGWELVTALGINDHGQVVGSGRHNGASHAYRLTLPKGNRASKE